VLKVGCKITNRQSGDVAADHCVGAGGCLDAAKHWLLDFRPFQDRFLDEVRFGDRFGHAIGSSDVFRDQIRRSRGEEPAVLEVVSTSRSRSRWRAVRAGSASTITTCRPAIAKTWVMPPPMYPAPTTAIRSIMGLVHTTYSIG
jgi:hypothetical protein